MIVCPVCRTAPPVHLLPGQPTACLCVCGRLTVWEGSGGVDFSPLLDCSDRRFWVLAVSWSPRRKIQRLRVISDHKDASVPVSDRTAIVDLAVNEALNDALLSEVLES